MRRVVCSTLVVLTANLTPLRAAVADVARLTVLQSRMGFETAACQVLVGQQMICLRTIERG